MRLRSIRRGSRALTVLECLICRLCSGDRKRDAEVGRSVHLGVILLHKLPLRLILIGKLSKVDRAGPVPSRRRGRTEAETSKLPRSYVVVLRAIVVMIYRGFVEVRLVRSIGCARRICIQFAIVAAVQLLCVLLRSSTRLI
jgi:hypothetical protein